MPKESVLFTISHILSKAEMHFKRTFSNVIFTGKVIILIRLFLLANQLKCSLFDLIRVYNKKPKRYPLLFFFFSVLLNRIIVFNESEDLLPLD